MSSIVLKVVFNGSAHRFTLAKPSMSDLIAQLKLSYPNLPVDAHIKYEDDENELITISTDNELMEAFNVAVAQGSRTLKLIVSTNSSLSSSNVEDSKVAAASNPASRAASPSRVVSPPRVVEPAKVASVPTASPKPAASVSSPKPAATASPKPEAAPATPKPEAAAKASGEESKFPGREEILDLLLSLVKNKDIQAILPQVLNAVLDEVSKTERSVKAIVDRVLTFAPIRDHVFTYRMLPFLDHVLPCADACLSRVNPALVAMARPLVPLVATMIPSAIAFLERLKAAGAGSGECPLGDLAGLAGLFGGAGAGPCGLAGLAKMFGPPTTTPNGDVEFDLGPIPPFLAGLFGGLSEEEHARSRSQPRGPCGPCGPRAGPCEPAEGGCPRSQSVPRGCPRRGGFGHPGFGHPGFGPHPHPHGFGGPHGPHGFGGPHGPHGFGGPHGPHGFGGPHGPHHFGGPHHGPRGFGGRHHGRHHGHPEGPFAGPFGGCARGPAPETAPATAEGEPHVWRNFACDGCNAHPIQGIRYHCTICKDYDLCEACEAKGVHPRHHPLVKLHVPRPPPSDEQAIHHGVTCDMCRVSPITGLRYRCTVCPDFDMCEKCEAKRLHPAEHPVIKLRTERHLPPHLPPAFQGEAGRPEGGCPRRGGGRCGRWRRWAEMAATAASQAAGAAATPEAKEEGGCPMFNHGAPAESTEQPTSVPQSAVKGPQATLLRHVTLPHGSKLEQGHVVVKTWSVQNNGQESWPETTKLIFLRGDRELLGETEEFSTVIAKPGQTVEVSVPITTPTKAANYTAYFQLADANRNVFGPRLWLEVVVTRDDEDERKLAPAAVSSSSPSVASSVPTVDTSGWIDVKVETSPVVKPVATAPAVVPATSLAPVAPIVTPATPVVPAVVAPKPVVAVAPSAPSAPAKYAAQLASLAAMGFNNSELNSFLLEKHNGDIQQVSNWLLENMNH